MADPFTTNTVKAPLRPGQGQAVERKVVLSQDHPAKKMDVSFDPKRYAGVNQRKQRVGLPAMQSSDLRAIAENKIRLRALAERKLAEAKAKAKKAAAAKAKAPAKGAGRKGK